jgi:ABC-2 type transport system permease protein
MKGILLIATNDLRRFMREKSGYFWLFGSPLLFAFFMGFANRGAGDPSNPRPKLAIEDRDGGFMARALKQELGAKGVQVVMVTNVPDQKNERTLVIPEGFTRDVAAKKAVKLDLSRLESSSEEAASMVELRLLRGVVALNSHLLEQSGSGNPPTEEAILKLRENPDPVSLKVSFGTRKAIPAGYNQSVPGILVMFTMMNLLIFGGATLAGERREGVIRRLMVQPLNRYELILGKIAGLLLLGAVQIVFLLVAARFLMGFRFSGSVGPLILTLGIYAWVAAALGVFIGSVISSEDKIIALCVLASLVMAAMGGCWWPLEIVPENVRMVGHIFPTAWTMGALHQLLSFGGGLANIVTALGVLVIYATLATFAAVKWFRI